MWNVLAWRRDQDAIIALGGARRGDDDLTFSLTAHWYPERFADDPFVKEFLPEGGLPLPLL